MSTYERIANWLAIGLFSLLLMLSVVGAVTLPDPVPIHYNLAGQIDRWGSPATLLILPFVGLIVLVILFAAAKVHPDFMNFPGPRTPENVTRQLRNTRLMLASLRVFIMALFLSLQTQTVWGMRNPQNRSIGWWLAVLLIPLFLLIGFFVWRSYRLIPRQ